MKKIENIRLLGLIDQTLIILVISVVFISSLFVADDLHETKPQKAETQYQLAANMVPHKFYLVYLLTNLYNETGQQEKAVVLARQLLNKEVKVSSQAIEEIREEMREVVNSVSTEDNTGIKTEKGKYHANFSSILIKQQFW